MTAKKRLIKYLKYKNISQYDFSRRTGLSNGYLNSGDNVTSANLDAITNIFVDLNLVWIVKGIGPMIIPEGNGQPTYTTVSEENLDNTSHESYLTWNSKNSDEKLSNMTPEQIIYLNSVFRLAIKSKDQTIQAKDDIIVTLKDLIAEMDDSNKLKDELISQLRQNQNKGSL